ncbi:cyclic pyranopterin monophosphate synthase subunit MoaA [Cnuella takakiae]|uniref:GTP 3',8-cyclase n=1 Tax=Cnuella takakiae TaxID=1302690 RepID=A0A1M5CN67_9BACT|nr:GTP 3',8-cyclase MoaA [Cnuella takakiae]OLY91884.1 cyclic pyranopterin phosphate synthase MoaA [Cnuella takakiae]SHF56106.1 cyclic pyranopterin monophosphate synthase subunit MoaA [Cnuella takakiae]
MILDSHNRIHNYLRISLTDNCNLRCFYCMPEEEYDFTPASRLMQKAEIDALARTFVAQGVKKIRLTGGEPLVRKDAADIILSLSRLPVELTLTTNGTRVHSFMDVFRDAGIRSLNISLDTLQSDKFLLVTRRDQFSLVKNNIRLLLDKGFHVKVNVVVMQGLNDTEILDFIAWTKDTPVHVRFIEFMPFSGNRWTSNKVVTLQQILDTIAQRYDFLPLKGDVHDTAKKFIVPGHAGTFAVISTMTAHFCGDCNRMRLTADGKLKNCLFSQSETDLLTPLRNGEDVLPLIHQSILSKAKQLGGQLPADFQNLQAEALLNRSMITIGG